MTEQEANRRARSWSDAALRKSMEAAGRTEPNADDRAAATRAHYDAIAILMISPKEAA